MTKRKEYQSPSGDYYRIECPRCETMWTTSKIPSACPTCNALISLRVLIDSELKKTEGEWEPIETAPRDGTPLRVKYSDGTEEDGVYWQEEGRHCVLGSRAGSLPPGWTSTAASHLPVNDITHWCPEA